MNEKVSVAVQRYLPVLLAPLFVAIFIRTTWPTLESAPISLYLLAIMFCAWRGGLYAGIASLIVSFGFAQLFHESPVWNEGHVARLLVLMLVGTVISFLCHRMQQARNRAEKNLAEVKKVHDALLAAERKYRDIFENAEEGIFQTTPDGHFLSANAALAQILGFENPNDLIESRKNIGTEIYVNPTHREKFKRQLAERGVIRGFEQKVLRKDGTHLWLTVNARTVRDEKGQILYYEGTAQDITERKHAEQRLREHEKVVESLEEMIVVMDRDLHYLLANRSFLKYRRLRREDVIGRLATDFIDKQVYQNIIKGNLERSFAGETVKYEMKYTYPYEGERDLFISYHPIESAEGIDRIACVLTDITARKQSERRLAYQAQLLQSVHDSIVAVDKHIKLTSWNRAAEQMYRWTAAQVLGRDLREVVRSDLTDEQHAAVFREAAETGICRRESVHHRKDNSLLNIDGTVMPLREVNGQIAGYVCAYHDITERKQAEEALRVFSRRLIEAQEAERQSISRELHDQIGQVLTAIRINLETIKKTGNETEATFLIDEGIAIVDQALKQVRNLSFELRPSLLDDLGLTAALHRYVDRYSQRTGIRVRTVINLNGSPGRLPRDLETVCFRIAQEALTNVARHAQAQNVSLKLVRVNTGIVLTVKDDGVGFDQRKTNGKGANFLGLRGMEERALALEGKLEIASSSKGTTITARFPVQK